MPVMFLPGIDKGLSEEHVQRCMRILICRNEILTRHIQNLTYRLRILTIRISIITYRINICIIRRSLLTNSYLISTIRNTISSINNSISTTQIGAKGIKILCLRKKLHNILFKIEDFLLQKLFFSAKTFVS